MAVRQDICEAFRLVDSYENTHAANIEAQLYAIAEKLFPELDWNGARQTVAIRVSDNTEPNARIYMDSQPVLCVTRGLLDLVRNEDELAYVIGHELGHDRIQNRLGINADTNTKGEEAGADVIGVLRCVQAGYSYNAAIDFLKRLENTTDQKPGQKILSRALDPHPASGNRIAVIETALANETLFKSGSVKETAPTQLSGSLADKEQHALLQHTSFLDRFLPAGYDELSTAEKMRWLAEAIEQTKREGRLVEQLSSTDGPICRPNYIFKALQAVDAAPDDEPARKQAERIISVIHDVDPNNAHNLFDRSYKVAANKVCHEGADLPALGPFKTLHYTIENNRDKAENGDDAACQTIKDQLGRWWSPYLSMSSGENNGNFLDTSRPRIQRNSEIIHHIAPIKKLNTLRRDLVEKCQKGYELTDKQLELAWYLGGAFDSEFRASLDKQTLESFIGIRPALGYSSPSQDRQDKEFNQLKEKIREDLLADQRTAAQENAKSFLDDPEQFIFAHKHDLFPPGNPNRFGDSPADTQSHNFLNSVSQSLQDIFSSLSDASIDVPGLDLDDHGSQGSNFQGRSRTYSYGNYKTLCYQIRDEIRAALESGDPESVQKATYAVQVLFRDSKVQTVPKWLHQNGQNDKNKNDIGPKKSRKRREQESAERSRLSVEKFKYEFNEVYHAYKIDAAHPYTQMILQIAQHLNFSDAAEKLNNVDLDRVGEQELRQALGLSSPDNIKSALEEEARLREDLFEQKFGS